MGASVNHPRTTANISEDQFLCPCCNEILLNPTTLTCGHTFCRHCLALWWGASHNNECPVCRQRWQGFPQINILLRNIIENLFREAVEQRRAQIQANLQIRRRLRAFQRIADNMARFWRNQDRGAIFFYAVLIALLCVAVLLYLFFRGVMPHFENNRQ